MQTISNEQFLKEISPLIDVFPSMKNRTRLERIYSFISELPLDAAKNIINQIGDTAKSAPTPSEFREQASIWKRNYYAKHGNYYGKEKIENQDITFCWQCQDSGILEMTPIGETVLSHHMRCECEFGSNHWAKLPQFAKALRQGFTVSGPHISRFKPASGEYDAINKKYKEWKAFLSSSENHWKNLGYIHKESL